MPGAGGGLPPMPGRGGGGGGPAMAANSLFEEIGVLMGQFERMSPRLAAAAQRAASAGLTAQEQMVATGQTSQSMHARFTSLQQRAQTIGGPNGQVQPADPNVASFVNDLQAFVNDFRAHNQDVERVVAKIESMGGGMPAMP